MTNRVQRSAQNRRVYAIELTSPWRAEFSPYRSPARPNADTPIRWYAITLVRHHAGTPSRWYAITLVRLADGATDQHKAGRMTEPKPARRNQPPYIQQ